jgi:hypothetical protein
VICFDALRATMGHAPLPEHSIAAHNDSCLTSDVDAFDWIDRAIIWLKENRSHAKEGK